MPESDALIPAEGGKRVTITIAELTGAELADQTTQPEDETGAFVISNGKYKLTITIAE